MKMKLSKEQLYFRDLTDKFNAELYYLSDEEIKKILLLEKKDRDILLNKIGRILLDNNIDEDYLNLSSKDKRNTKRELDNLINSTFNEEIKYTRNSIKKILFQVGIDKFYSNTFLMSLGINFTLKKISNEEIYKIIDSKIEGKNYSDRLWTNKNKVAKELKIELKNFIDGKTTKNDIEKIIKKKFNQNAYNTKRLVETETSKVLEGANEVWAEKHDIKHVMYSATLDFKTCKDCGGHDGEVYSVDNKPFKLPRHPKCRCSYISLPSKDWKPHKRINNETKEIIDYKSYKEWKNQQDL